MIFASSFNTIFILSMHFFIKQYIYFSYISIHTIYQQLFYIKLYLRTKSITRLIAILYYRHIAAIL